MSNEISVTNCDGLTWLALWTFLLMLALWLVAGHLRDISKSQRRIAASYPAIIDPNSVTAEKS